MDIAERVSGTGGGLWWLSPDPVGTVSLQINAFSGTVTRRWMDPFGTPRTTATTWSSPHGYLNAPRSATGLTQLGARAYDPAMGRFISVDPLLDTGEPRHSNAYAYAMNSPVSYSDANGLAPRIESADGNASAPTRLNATGVKPKPTFNGTTKPTRTPPPPGNENASAGTPSATESSSGGDDFWRTAGAIGMGILVGTGITLAFLGAAGCAAVTAGFCVLVIAGAGAAAGVVTYGLSTDQEDRTPEGYAVAAVTSATLGLATLGLGVAATRALASLAASRPGPIVANVADDLLPGVKPGWTTRVADNNKGQVWQQPGSTGNANSVRVMEATERYPNGYVRFYNEHGQPVGLNGKPGPRPDTHIPRAPDGSYAVPEGW